MIEFSDENNEVIKLLMRLKNVNGGYPPEMLALRRQRYLKQLAQVSAGAGIGTALRQTLKSGSSPAVPMAGPVGKLLEVLLVVVIVAEAGAMAYMNRDKLINLFRTISTGPAVQELSAQPETLPSLTETSLTSTPDLTETATPIGTPSPNLLAYPSLPTDNHSGANSQANATANPNGNNGNHYGNTPKPERTKKPGNGGGNFDKKSPER